MCYNCGCGLPNDPMGKKTVSEGGPSLVEDDIKKMSEGWGMSVEESKKNMLEMLQKQIGKK
ncbi:MAG: hypothetical protein HYV90_03420 [Candidatus Woesebacteria bacterium]|nr:MAG: hypothetical protein HYV90_03420 [Candidatus Woesebacteria bacterium]